MLSSEVFPNAVVEKFVHRLCPKLKSFRITSRGLTLYDPLIGRTARGGVYALIPVRFCQNVMGVRSILKIRTGGKGWSYLPNGSPGRNASLVLQPGEAGPSLVAPVKAAALVSPSTAEASFRSLSDENDYTVAEMLPCADSPGYESRQRVARLTDWVK